MILQMTNLINKLFTKRFMKITYNLLEIKKIYNFYKNLSYLKSNNSHRNSE